MKKITISIFLSLFCFFTIIPEGFYSETLIKTPFNNVAIKNLSPNDTVISYFNKSLYTNNVQFIIKKQVSKHIVIHLEKSSIMTTHDQLFYSDNSWIKAKELTINNKLYSITGKYIPIKSIDLIFQPIEIYALNLNTPHTYCVSKHEIVVHNFTPIISLGIEFLFGSGAIEFAGTTISAGAIALGSYLGIHAFKKNKEKTKLKPLVHNIKNEDPSPKRPNNNKNNKDIKPLIFREEDINHIFDNRPGHIVDTAKNRKLLIDIASDKSNFLGFDRFNNEWYGKIINSGKQIWASTRNGIIQNGGINEIPHTFNPITGLCRLIK